MRLAGLPIKVVGVLVTDIFPPSAARLLRIAQKTARLVGPEAVTMARAMSASDFVIERDFVGGGYGQALPAADQFGAWLRAVEGIEVDATYSAKTAYALDRSVRAGRWGKGPFLFWLTFSRVRIADRLQPLPDFRELPASFHKFFA
jgi:1-aminocyclopropane-1-carboxylate deaminase/D-cysteine desulfhydrase-like pyridoxal-dependent ACC family enzyme